MAAFFDITIHLLPPHLECTGAREEKGSLGNVGGDYASSVRRSKRSADLPQPRYAKSQDDVGICFKAGWQELFAMPMNFRGANAAPDGAVSVGIPNSRDLRGFYSEVD
jgi:hypothetical protein